MKGKILIGIGIIGILFIVLTTGCMNNTQESPSGADKETENLPEDKPGIEQEQDNKTAGKNDTKTGQETKQETGTEQETQTENNTGTGAPEETKTDAKNETGIKEANETVADNKTETLTNETGISPEDEEFNVEVSCEDGKELTFTNRNSYDYSGCTLIVNDEYYFFGVGYTFHLSSMHYGGPFNTTVFTSPRKGLLLMNDNRIYNYVFQCNEGIKSEYLF